MIEAPQSKILPARWHWLLGEVELSLHGPDLREMLYPGCSRVKTKLRVTPDCTRAWNTEELNFGECSAAGEFEIHHLAIWTGTQFRLMSPMLSPFTVYEYIRCVLEPAGLMIEL